MTDPYLALIRSSIVSISHRLDRIDRLLTVGIWILTISTVAMVAMLGYGIATFGLPGS